jgi:hypothetical protein
MREMDKIDKVYELKNRLNSKVAELYHIIIEIRDKNDNNYDYDDLKKTYDRVQGALASLK